MAKTPLTEGTRNALNVLQANEGQLTLEEMNTFSDEKIASAHLTSLVKRGLVEAEDVEVEVLVTKTVKGYKLTEAGVDYDETPAETQE